MVKGWLSSVKARCATRPAARIAAACSGTLRSAWRRISFRAWIITELYSGSGPLKMTNSKKAMVPFLALHVDRRSPIPLQRQLFNCLRDAILAGRLAPGVRLPATRVLSADLGVSRNTVVGAFDQLLAEGYLEGKVGSGTYVARQIPEQLLRVGPPKTADAGPAGPPLRLSRRGQYLAGIRVSLNQGVALPRPFRPGLPAFDQFPRALWTRLAARLLRRVPAATLTY